jgi:hypothetical protein
MAFISVDGRQKVLDLRHPEIKVCCLTSKLMPVQGRKLLELLC